MGFLDWFRSPPSSRFSSTIARELAEAVFALHPSAEERVVLTLEHGLVASMEVFTLDPRRDSPAQVDPAAQTARISQLAAELSKSAAPTSGNSLTVMRDRVIWMPAVLTFSPPVP